LLNISVETNAIKFLGLQLDSQLSWNPHINYLLHLPSSVSLIMRKSNVFVYKVGINSLDTISAYKYD